MSATPETLGGSDTSRVTIYDVASRAGVSIATVSHTLNRPEKVSAATRARVLKAVDALGFTPKQTAVSLARKGVGRIAVIGPFGAYPSYFERLIGILHVCRERRIEVVVFDDDALQPRSPLLNSLPTTGRVDGLIIMGVEPDDSLAHRLADRQIPTVLLDRTQPAFCSVTVNDELGGRLVAEHFVAQGARRCAFASPAPPETGHITSGELRLVGFRAGLRAAGVTDDPQWIITEDTIEAGRDVAATLVAQEHPPDAVFAVHDQLAAGIIGGLRDAGVAVPQAIRVAGYDDTDLARALGITTVGQPLSDSGRSAAELLLQRLTHRTRGAPVQQISLTPALIVRGST